METQLALAHFQIRILNVQDKLPRSLIDYLEIREKFLDVSGRAMFWMTHDDTHFDKNAQPFPKQVSEAGFLHGVVNK